jgi:phosphinothricin acetyltransferase
MAAIIRTAVPEDAPALREIYAPYVEGTAITFEYEPPSPEEFRQRMVSTLARYPYLCLEEDGCPLGYAYASPFRSRAAYRWTAEISIYLAPRARGRGFGRRLLEALEERCRAMGLQTLYACVSLPEGEDPRLDENSARFHEHMGYRQAGLLRCSGYKFGRWYHTLILEKNLGDHPPEVREVTWFPELQN